VAALGHKEVKHIKSSKSKLHVWKKY